jgi:TPR repeat protein
VSSVEQREENKMAKIDMAIATQAEGSLSGAAAEALFNLGMMYCIGRNVKRDLVAAHKWFNLAALRGSQQARTWRVEISQEMSGEEIAAAQRQARQWLTLH